MLLADSKHRVLSTAFLMALAIAATASAQNTRLAQHPGIDQTILNQPQPVMQVQPGVDQVVGDCGCNTGYAGSAHSGLTLCDIVHGCAFKRDTANLWDGYCQENKTHCDNGCSPLFKGRLGCGAHGGMLGGSHNCGLAGGTRGGSAGCGQNVPGTRGLLGSSQCSACGGNCHGACQGKTTTTTLPVISTKSGYAAGCADAHSNQIQAPPAETAPKAEAADQQQEAKPVSIRTRYPHLFPENE